MQVLKKTDLTEIRNANMRIVKDKENSPADISRASRIVMQLKELEIKLNKPIDSFRLRPARGEHDEPEERLVDTFGQLKIVG